MKMEIVPCAHPINCDTIFDPHVAEFLQLYVSEGVWHEEDGRNNSGAENLSNSDNDSRTQHDWFSDDDLSSCEGESSLYVINVGTRGSVSIPRCQTESSSGALVACAVRLCDVLAMQAIWTAWRTRYAWRRAQKRRREMRRRATSRFFVLPQKTRRKSTRDC